MRTTDAHSNVHTQHEQDYRAARSLLADGQSAAARTAYDRLLRLVEQSKLRALILSDLGAIAAQQGRTDEARHLFQQALATDRDCRAAQKNLEILERLSPTPREYSNGKPIRIAVVSVLFNWPSTGGGNVHTVELVRALHSARYNVQHFYLSHPSLMTGEVSELTIPSQAVIVDNATFSVEKLQDAFRDCVARFRPDVVFLTDCWNLKPWLADALSDFPLIHRFDALECLCPLNNLRLIPESDRLLVNCHRHRLATPGHCHDCVGEYGRHVGPRHSRERQLSRIDSPEYEALLHNMLERAEAVLVHNPLIAAHLEPYARDVRVVPIGVDRSTFGAVPQLTPSNKRDAVKFLLFAGRTTDPVKGFQLLERSCEALWQERQDFRVLATGIPVDDAPPFIEWRQWQTHATMPALLGRADILVAPSVGNEPFGLSVVEAMAAGRPVVASCVGGHQFTMKDGVTGLLFTSDDAADLTEKLRILLDSEQLRIRYGAAGQEHFCHEFAWEAVVTKHYQPLIQRIISRRSSKQ